MNHASLFSGIGGFDLAAEWMGWRNVFHVERDPFCQRVLAYHFPNSQPFDDVTTFDGRPWRGRVDILTGGFPCQPYSTAGKRLGKEDERHLWPEMRRIISEIAPTYVVGENVRGLTNWNGGLVFEEVCVDLEALGYEVWTGIIPAAGVGAPHRRDRVWFVAHANGRSDVRTPGRDASASEGIQERDEVRIPDQSSNARLVANCENLRRSQTTNLGREWTEHEPNDRDEVRRAFNAIGASRDVADTNNAGTHKFVRNITKRQEENKRRERQPFPEFGPCCGNAPNAERDGLEHGTERGGVPSGKGATRERVAGHAPPACWARFPTQPPVCGGDDGLPRELDGITFSKWRNESIKAYGNAIVPQVAYQLFRALCDVK